MSQSEGQEIFESYLSSIEDGELNLASDSSDAALRKHFDDHLQSKLSEKYNDPMLEIVREQASTAYDIAKVRRSIAA